eukprot:3575955-Amphidinium_carterae.1
MQCNPLHASTHSPNCNGLEGFASQCSFFVAEHSGHRLCECKTHTCVTQSATNGIPVQQVGMQHLLTA